MKKYNIGNRSHRKRARFWLFLAIVLVSGAVAAATIALRTYNQNLQPYSSSQRAVIVTILPGSTVDEIAKKLQQEGIIRAPWAFEWYVRNNGLRDKLQAGTYSLRPSQSVKEVIEILTQGKVSTAKVTILPGKRLDQIRDSLINDGFLPESVDAALEAAQYADSPALSDKPPGASLEGYLYPETFQKTADTKPEAIIRASLDQMQKNLTPDIRAAIIKQGLTIHEGVILASIIEQEVSNPVDKPVVAQIFLRRIHENLSLGSDVTAFYGAIKANKAPSVAYDSPYNTRLHSGFPPGPISNVSATSLQAVATPAHTNYLFFVAGDDGKTYFSYSVEEHEALTGQHCKRLCQ